MKYNLRTVRYRHRSGRSPMGWCFIQGRVIHRLDTNSQHVPHEAHLAQRTPFPGATRPSQRVSESSHSPGSSRSSLPHRETHTHSQSHSSTATGTTVHRHTHARTQPHTHTHTHTYTQPHTTATTTTHTHTSTATGTTVHRNTHARTQPHNHNYNHTHTHTTTHNHNHNHHHHHHHVHSGLCFSSHLCLVPKHFK